MWRPEKQRRGDKGGCRVREEPDHTRHVNTRSPAKIVSHPNRRREMLDIDVFAAVEPEIQIREFKAHLGCCMSVLLCMHVSESL